jgi:hypothetical protein
MSSNLIIGSSHALLFAEAVGAHAGDVFGTKDTAIPITSASGNDNKLIYVMPQPGFVKLQRTPAGAIEAAFDAPIDEIRTYNSEASKVVFMVGGNEPAANFFYRNPRPFDLVYPGTPQAGPGRQILPLAVMKGVVADMVAKSSLSTQALARELPKARKFYLSVPPPIPSEEHIRKFPEIFDFKTHGIEDPLIRLKIHRIQMQHMADLCAAYGITFVDTAVGKTDEQGFLQETYWDGCTHASVDYYRDIVDALEL